MIDAALMHLIKSEYDIQNAHNEHPSHVIQEIASMSDLTLCYCTRASASI
ncbi:DUF7386 family protein [Natrinema soli]|uniref:Uncharacterized protein n=1 Tax=Natrinema soli TaxID=1930624 RepID=A0ABD5SIM9_9EURY|nr:hypothetical protein [Natrinema soli]